MKLNSSIPKFIYNFSCLNPISFYALLIITKLEKIYSLQGKYNDYADIVALY